MAAMHGMKRATKRRPAAGFTLLELIFVLFIGAIIMSIGVKQFGKVQIWHQVTNARDALVYMGVRAQSEAMKHGDLVRIEIWPDTNMAKIVTPSDSMLERVRFDSQFGVDVIGAAIKACYSSRGFALPSCTTTGLPQRIGFVLVNDTAAAKVLPLGQIEKIQ
jgi:prepilin-type N-terminal cleavage/methylation domain-containing protein